MPLPDIPDWDGDSSVGSVEDDQSRPLSPVEPDPKPDLPDSRGETTVSRLPADVALSPWGLVAYPRAEWVEWYGGDVEYDESRKVSALVDQVINHLIQAESSSERISHGIDQFIEYLLYKMDLKGAGSYTKELHRALFMPMHYRQRFLRRMNLREDSILTRDQGCEVIANWRSDFVTIEGNAKRNAFWAHVDQTCGSQTLAKLAINIGASSITELTNAVADIIDVKFSQKHLDLVKTNAKSYERYASRVRQRAKTLKYELKRAEKLIELQSQCHKSVQDDKILKDYVSGRLGHYLERALADHEAVKRRGNDIFSNPVVLHPRKAKRVGRHIEQGEKKHRR
jgi:hypothetical protein